MSIRLPRLQLLSALFYSVFLASMLLALATPLWAQKYTGSIVGMVKDPSGAVVPRGQGHRERRGSRSELQ